MDVGVERPPPVKEENKPDTMQIGSALPMVLESFPSTQRNSIATSKDDKLEATKAEMGETHFHDAVKVKQQAPAADKLPASAPAPTADDLVSLSLGSGGYSRPKGAHQRSLSSSSSGTETDPDDQLSLGLSSRRSTDGDDRQAARPSATPLMNLSSDSSADDTAAPGHDLPAAACPTATKARKSPGAGVDGADDEVLQQQAKKARVSVRVKCDTPTMNDGCQWRKYGQKISKGTRARAPITATRCRRRRGHGLHHLRRGIHAARRLFLVLVPRAPPPFASAGLLGPTTISTIASCPTVTLDLTAPHSLMQQQYQSPYAAAMAAGYESKALPAAWSSGYLAPYGGAAVLRQELLAGDGAAFWPGHGDDEDGAAVRCGPFVVVPAENVQRRRRPWRTAAAPAVTDTIAKAITSDPSFQSVLAAAITSYMGRGAGRPRK
ncbi:hypothetical protein ZWY2020_017027 [Hordeum vulgare]|nr:hypothetical protein ZWY2020_017027 [Hordeum vulgare]